MVQKSVNQRGQEYVQHKNLREKIERALKNVEGDNLGLYSFLFFNFIYLLL